MTKRDSWEALEDAEKRVDLLLYTLEENRPVPCGAPWAAVIQQLRMFKTHLVALRALDADTLSPSAPTEREKASAWRPISEVGTFEEVTVYEAGNGQAIGHRDAMGEWWTPLPLRPLNMNPTHFKPLDLPPAPAAEKE